LTQRATHYQSSPNNKQGRPASLVDAINAQAAAEIASFHTPGHKGQTPFENTKEAWRLDVTELPGLDDLSRPKGVLLELQNMAADLYGAACSFISLNGASGAIMAGLLACATRGTHVLLPRNTHRSAVNALVLSGLQPVWFEPTWDDNWQSYGGADVSTFAAALRENADRLACALIVSPTYTGEISDIKELAELCHQQGVPLLVDEAHGAHLLPGSSMPTGALAYGADLVAHSAHKTMGALTQTGFIHVGKSSLVPPEAVLAALNLQQTSSPSYLLLASLEKALLAAQDNDAWQRLTTARQTFDMQIRHVPSIEIRRSPGALQDPLHIYLRSSAMRADELYDECCEWGVFPEAVLGNGVLFLLGIGTRVFQLDSLSDALENIVTDAKRSAGYGTNAELSKSVRLTFGEQVLPPRQAFLSQCETISLSAAVGRIAAECIAPCPPGIPVTVPGMRVTDGAIASSLQTHLRVVVESGQGEHR
jgi:arginine decarboxylase